MSTRGFTADLRRKALKDQVFLDIANKVGELGTCDRAHIGAVITRAGRCVAWGYNGAAPGMPHCDENWHGQHSSAMATMRKNYPDLDHEVEQGDQRYIEFMEIVEDRLLHEGCRNATHAEANALAFAARQGISTESCTLYVSQSPCLNCSRLLIAAGIIRVVYDVEYRDTVGIEFLQYSGVEVGRCEDGQEDSG